MLIYPHFWFGIPINSISATRHLPWEASRIFCGAIREYAECIGKQNFLLLGEITGGTEMARNYLEIFGRNINVVLDIGEPARLLAETLRGLTDACEFFELYSRCDVLGSHRETGRYHVLILDDHDMVGREIHRFAAHNKIKECHHQVAHAVGFQL